MSSQLPLSRRRRRSAAAQDVHRGGPRRRRSPEAGQLDYRPDLLHRHLHLRRHAVGHRLRRAEAAPRGVRPIRQSQRTGRRAKAGRAWRAASRRCCSAPAWRRSPSFLLAKLRSGDEVVLFDECYHRTRQFCAQQLGKFGVRTHQIPACDYERMEAAITPNTKLLISESPTNPHLSVVDLERFAALGKKHGVETLIDATLATPYNVRPLEAGIDYVLHSCTKYLAGHNDMLGGVVIGSEEKMEPIRKARGLLGTVNAPHNIYLLLRGLKTFELRMQRHNENGLAVAAVPRSHPRIEKVYYPGLPSHAYYEVAKRTMRGFGGAADVPGEGRRLAGDGRRRRRGAAAADRAEPGRRRVDHRAALPDELPRLHARATRGRRHPRQHDPAVLRHRKRRGPDRRSGPSAWRR